MALYVAKEKCFIDGKLYREGQHVVADFGDKHPEHLELLEGDPEPETEPVKPKK